MVNRHDCRRTNRCWVHHRARKQSRWKALSSMRPEARFVWTKCLLIGPFAPLKKSNPDRRTSPKALPGTNSWRFLCLREPLTIPSHSHLRHLILYVPGVGSKNTPGASQDKFFGCLFCPNGRKAPQKELLSLIVYTPKRANIRP